MASLDRVLLKFSLLSFFVLYNLSPGWSLPTSAEPEPETTAEAEPEKEPAPEGEGEITPEEFWKWLRDDPVWMALIGMGFVVLLLVIIIIVLICRLKPSKG